MIQIVNLCPICSGKSTELYPLSSAFLKSAIQSYFNIGIKNASVIDDLGIIDYSIRKCKQCTLQFAVPLTEGSSSYYKWVTRQPYYYPSSRWEFEEVKKMIQNKKKEQINLIDIGCGPGFFLDTLTGEQNLYSIGIDTTQTTIDICKTKILNAECIDLDSFLNEDKSNLNKFDYVVSFHCLEHIANPLQFVQSMTKGLSADGSILVSTPYSPMFFEKNWFDIQNHPPHHMTRWNAKAYKALASKLDLSIKFYFPKASSLKNRAVYAFLYSKVGIVRQPISKKEIFKLIFKHPFDAIKNYFHQLRRDKINGETVGDVILVEFKKR